jgi:hypothetical protein
MRLLREALVAAFCVGAAMAQVQTLPMPAGGTVHVGKSAGELAVEGWDRPEVELTSRPVNGAKVAMTRKGGEILIETTLAKKAEDERLNYRIRMPRGAKLVVEHGAGEVHVAGVTGDIRATVSHGEIVLSLPAGGQYGIDARASVGDVVSDFPGQSKRRPWVFGHWFQSGKQAGQTHQLYLRAGFGDILILKTIQPSPIGRTSE